MYREYMEKIRLAFFPKRGFGYSLLQARSAFNDIDEPFYNSIEGIYKKSLTIFQKASCLEKYQKHAFKLMDSTYDFGWGFYDSLSWYYSEFYRETEPGSK